MESVDRKRSGRDSSAPWRGPRPGRCERKPAHPKLGLPVTVGRKKCIEGGEKVKSLRRRYK